MAVVLAGVGADSTNVGTVAPLLPDGRFDYVPIPEKTHAATEEETFGSWPLRTDEGVAAELTTQIDPQPVQGDRESITGTAIADWPFHHDPNFEALTYGEHRSTGYLERLHSLESGDIVGFYAGLRDPETARAHRYLIGYFTVDRIDVVTPEMSAGDRREILERHPENAHTKRAQGSELYREEKPVVFIDGREPGGLFDRHPIRLSEYRVKDGNVRAQYYLRKSVASMLSVTEGKTNMQFKPAYRCACSAKQFRTLVGPLTGRTAEDAALTNQSVS